MGLAWLSLFFSWNVNMVVEAHKVLKKRRHRHRRFYEEPEPAEDEQEPDAKPTVIDIFDFPKEEDYSTVIKEIGASAQKLRLAENINRSKSCSDILTTNIRTLEHSPKHRRMISISEVFVNAKADKHKGEQKEGGSLIQEGNRDPKPGEGLRTDDENNDSCAFDPETEGIVFTVPTRDATEEGCVQNPEGRGTRFKISKVVEEDLLMDNDEKR